MDEERERNSGANPDGGYEDDVEEYTEELIEHADRPMATFGTTAEEERRGEPLDARLAHERAVSPRERDDLEMFDESGTDDEPEMVGEAAAEHDPFLAPEDAAMSVRDTAPGAVDHPDDYVDEEEAGTDQA